jgi:hypothetical protein
VVMVWVSERAYGDHNPFGRCPYMAILIGAIVASNRLSLKGL